MRYNEITPHIVAAELTDEGTYVDTSVSGLAVSNTQAAWKA